MNESPKTAPIEESENESVSASENVSKNSEKKTYVLKNKNKPKVVDSGIDINEIAHSDEPSVEERYQLAKVRGELSETTKKNPRKSKFENKKNTPKSIVFQNNVAYYAHEKERERKLQESIEYHANKIESKRREEEMKFSDTQVETPKPIIPESPLSNMDQERSDSKSSMKMRAERESLEKKPFFQKLFSYLHPGRLRNATRWKDDYDNEKSNPQLADYDRLDTNENE